MDWVALASVISSASVAIWSIQRSQHQFVSQRWWERKAETYSALVEALTNMAFFLDRYYSDVIGERKLSDEEAGVLRKLDREAQQAIERLAYTGVFVISEPVAEELRRLVRELRRQGARGS